MTDGDVGSGSWLGMLLWTMADLPKGANAKKQPDNKQDNRGDIRVRLKIPGGAIKLTKRPVCIGPAKSWHDHEPIEGGHADPNADKNDADPKTPTFALRGEASFLFALFGFDHGWAAPSCLTLFMPHFAA